MDSTRILDLFLFSIPAVITGLIAYFFFKMYFKNENDQRKYAINKDLQETTLPMRLQAYERLTLFLERISPNKLLTRVSPISSNKDNYEALLIQNIQQEMEHNLTQQIYVSTKCWNIINTSKNATIQIIRKANMLEKTDTADKLREVILTEMMDRLAPSDTALLAIKEEVNAILQ